MEWMKKRTEERKLKGSFTVELACLVPVILFVIFGVLTLSFYTHHKVWLTAAAYEAAEKGAVQSMFDRELGIATAGECAAERWESWFQGDDRYQVKEKENKLYVTYTGRISGVYGGFLWNLKVQGESLICCPVVFIRNCRNAEKILKGD